MNDIEHIKTKLDIVDFLKDYVDIVPAGANFKARCPFHNEKTPSFVISRERQVWHCFGCAKGGDIFTFVQEMEGMDFPEALRFLAQKAGVSLDQVRNTTETSQKNRIKDVNEAACSFYHKFLMQMDTAKDALEYIHGRGLHDDTIRLWRIGYIPQQWDLLTKYLLKKGFSIDDLVASGLTIKKDGAREGRGFYDRFRDRIMFPIVDAHGAVVGFTGRLLHDDGEQVGGKYVNTPQTPVYDKSAVVFGLFFAKKAIKNEGVALVVEGQMDVVAVYQAGMEHVVASSGTALTEQQLQLLKRYTSNILLSFDADEAGYKAAVRGIDIAQSIGMRVRIIQLPEGKGKDPDECLQKNPDVWFSAVRDAREVMEWFFDRAFFKKDLTNPYHKQEIAEQLLPRIAAISAVMQREHWLETLANKLHVDTAVLRAELPRRSVISGSHMKTPGVSVMARESNVFDSHLERAVMLVLRYPNLFTLFNIGFEGCLLSSSEISTLYGFLRKVYTDDKSFSIDKLRDYLDNESQRKYLDILLLKLSQEIYDISEDEAKVELERIATYLRKEMVVSRLKELSTQLGGAIQRKDKVAEESLLMEVKQLQQQL